MAEKQVQTKNGVTYPADGTVVTSNKKRLSLFGRKKHEEQLKKPHVKLTKKPIFIVVGVALVALAAAAYLVLMQDDPVKKEAKSTVVTNPKDQKKLLEAREKAQKTAREQYGQLIQDKKYDEARTFVATMPILEAEKKTYLETINGITNRDEDLKKYLALESTKDFNYTVAESIGDVYAQQNNPAKARQYYSKALVLLAATQTPTLEADQAVIKEKINAL